jgi:hypothetical protein
VSRYPIDVLIQSSLADYLASGFESTVRVGSDLLERLSRPPRFPVTALPQTKILPIPLMTPLLTSSLSIVGPLSKPVIEMTFKS